MANTPSKNESILKVGMSELQKRLYKDLQKKANDTDISVKNLQNIAMQMRECCNHPYLCDGESSLSQEA